MKRKYLDKLGITSEKRPDGYCKNDKRQTKWKKERKKYGFDEREMWNMDYTFYLWLYERLRYFLNFAPNDLAYHTFEYKGKVLTQKQCIKKMIKGCEIRLTKENWEIDKEARKLEKEVAEIWALVLPAMWW